MVTLSLIENPPFTVTFENLDFQLTSKSQSLREKIEKIVSCSFVLLINIFQAVIKSGSLTLKYSGKAFKQIVLGFENPMLRTRVLIPINPILFVLKIAFWQINLLKCFIFNSVQLAIKKYTDEKKSRVCVKPYESGLDLHHLQSRELIIDVSKVDETVKIDDLMTMLEEINFTDSQQPGYMPQESRKEDGHTYPVSELQEKLQVFIYNVKGKVAFISTPSQYNTPRLMTFYQKIEDMVRYCIQYSNQEIANFRSTHGIDYQKYSDDTKQAYKNLLEDRAKIAIDLAKAGKRCGSRYMGDCLSLYSYFYNKDKDTDILSEHTLQDSLYKILADCRKEIAEQLAGKFANGNTHLYSLYFEKMGGLLAIPGTANVSEQLITEFDLGKHLTDFFNIYTEDFIIEAIEKAICQSQSLREKILDWIQAQRGNWNAETVDDQVSACIGQLQTIIELDKEVDQGSKDDDFDCNWQYFQVFVALIKYIKEKFPTEIPNSDLSWSAFLDELFALKEVKVWLKEQFKAQLDSLNGRELFVQQQKIKQKVKNIVSEEVLDQEYIVSLREYIKNGSIIEEETFKKLFLEKIKIQKIKKNIPLDDAIIFRILRKQISLQEAVRGYFNRLMDAKFLAEIISSKDFIEELMTEEGDPGEEYIEGLKRPAVLEWLLVSHRIFKPQLEE